MIQSIIRWLIQWVIRYGCGGEILVDALRINFCGRRGALLRARLYSGFLLIF